MKALVYRGLKKLQIDTVELPDMGVHDVQVSLTYCGVCGTDHHIYSGAGGAFEVKPPLIMGHEFSGIVEKVGSAVMGIQEGDLVTVDPNNMCGQCYFCNNAQGQFCENIIGIGTTVDGGFAENIVVDQKQVYKFKKGVDPLIASMTEPVSCCVHGIDLCHIKLGDEVLIIGGGPIGLIMLQLAQMAGAGKVVLSEPVEEKRVLAKKLGADITIDPLTEDVGSILSSRCENINVVIECVGNTKTIENALQWAGYGATVMLFGLTSPHETVSIAPEVVFKKELKLTSSFINPYTFKRAISILESGKLNVKDLITDIVPLASCSEVFEDPSYRRRGKVVVELTKEVTIK